MINATLMVQRAKEESYVTVNTKNKPYNNSFSLYDSSLNLKPST